MQLDSRHKEILEKIKDKVYELNPEAEIILYGSRARGTPHEESDWDLLILLNQKEVSRKLEQTFRHHLFDLELEFAEAISTFVLSKDIWNSKYKVTPFYKNVIREGIKL
ncbi:MAG: nucleotidyltransferase domain-containing protein [Bacteroidetes bacterium]|nr:nucleotidyltransferase domain-containing protein [Bacteroidota bacterium]MBL7103903.1 nucleotidyltransferase domain-containing protein [Bacteroidales bacterium]